MAPRPVARARRPGGRSSRVVSSVMRATLEVLGRVGFARLRVEDVAVRSHVNKTTIYRRWPVKVDLVRAALMTVGGSPDEIDTGDIRQDLLESFIFTMRGWTTERGRGALRILAGERADPDVDALARMVRERYRAPRRVLIERAVARGEMPGATDIELLLDVLTSTVVARVRCRPGPLDASWLAQVVDFSLAGARATLTAVSRKAAAPSPRRTPRRSVRSRSAL